NVWTEKAQRWEHASQYGNGLLGKVHTVEVGLPGGKTSPQGDSTIKSPPESLDYDMWCGPSEKLPFMECRYHWNWRWHMSYGGGQLMDWIGHHNDIAHWGLGQDKAGPISVQAKEFEYVSELMEVYNSPRNYTFESEYDGGTKVIVSSKNRGGTKWIGENGWVFVTRGKIEASNPAWIEEGFVPGDWKGYHPGAGHQANFIDCIMSRKDTICTAETGHRSATPGHLAYLSNALGGAKLKWDSQAEKIVGNDEAQAKLMDLPYRGDWKLV
ncbi:MAG: gfo/Idh/MocA family oxidoreductase, partial [Verrucomicrobiota bacterium]